ncbi:MAG: ABC transporter permease [Cyclobacteriaceae bacterium]|nr:ABC transporter permease [Cyclobacteriaceae bacterium]MCH8515096.1 ABC transporter permease [Cyclobacteriaceae bacterium]
MNTKILQLEWLKIKHKRSFQILLLIYLISLVTVLFSGQWLLAALDRLSIDFEGYRPSMLPIYEFPDIWHNISYVAYYLAFIPAIMLIISMGMEYENDTLKQHIIDGLKPTEFLMSKLWLIICFATIHLSVVFLVGMTMGLNQSYDRSISAIFKYFEFLPVLFFQVVGMLLFVCTLTLFIKKTGLSILIFILYFIIIEPIISGVLFVLAGDNLAIIRQMLPARAISEVISFPFGRYVFREVLDYIPISRLISLFFWIFTFCTLSYIKLSRSDIK